MHVADAQREVRTVYLGGSVGQAVSGTIWLVSAALGTWVSHTSAIIALILGGTFIFVITTLALKAMGRPAALSRENPMGQLAMQVAFTIPLAYPLIGAAALHNLNWFYPACMVVVGAHYLPFVFLYGMPYYGALAGAMVVGGWFVGTREPHAFTPGGWITAAMLIVSSLILLGIARRQDATAAGGKRVGA
jgi:hypothetical protein